MHILIAIECNYEQRIADAVKRHGPSDREVNSHTFHTTLPTAIDDLNPSCAGSLPDTSAGLRWR